MSRSDFYPYPARPGVVIRQLEALPGAEPKIMNTAEIERVIVFEHSLYDLTLPTGNFPNAANYLHNSSQTGQAIVPLEAVWRKKVHSSEFGTQYFLTDEGKAHLLATTGVEHNGGSLDDCVKTLASIDTTSIDSKVLDKLEADSMGYEESFLTNAFIDGGLVSSAVPDLNSVVIYKNPEVLVEKLVGFRQLKNYLAKVRCDIKSQALSGPEQDAMLLVTDLYRQRINRFIADNYVEAYKILHQHTSSGGTVHVSQVGELEGLVPAFRPGVERATAATFLQRMDRYRQGVGLDDSGKFTWLSTEAKQVSETADQNTNKPPRQRSLYSDIAVESLHGTNVDGEKFGDMLRGVLQTWNLLSSDEEWSSERTGPAKDNLWQVIVLDTHKSLAVNDKQRIVKVPLKDRSLASAIMLANHELTHVIQNENKRNIARLALQRVVGLDNVTEQTESGGLWQERVAEREITGQEDVGVSGIGYLEITKLKADGASYSACVEAYYKDLQNGNPKLSSSQLAAQAVNRARRVFRSGGFQYAQHAPEVTNTQPLNYLEQRLIYEGLDESHRKYLFVGGITIDNLVTLASIGLVDTSKITIPEKMPWQLLHDDVARLIGQQK